MNPLLTHSATRLASLIRTREVSSRAVVQAHIDRIAAVNGRLNAVVRERFEAALAEADAADEMVGHSAPDTLPPLHGVPFTVKECFALTGMPNSSGLVSRKDVIATEDATGVRRLRAAGAIPLGVTNVSELCMWYETDNRVYGRTNNPYDQRRTVGGSSGGEGAIIGAGGSPFGLGADVGGSIRMPAFFSGVFGHKPTGGLVPGTGQFPVHHNEALRYNCTGPLARRAEDLWPLLQVLLGPDGEDSGCEPMPMEEPSSVRLAGLPVLVVEDNGSTPVSDEIRGGLQKAARELEAAGAVVTQARFDGLSDSFALWSAAMTQASEETFAEMLGGGTAVSPAAELLKRSVGRSTHTLPSLVLAAIEGGAGLSKARLKRQVQKGLLLRRELIERIGDGVLLYPPFSTVAPPHHRPLLAPFRFVYTAIFNVMQLPVTAVPLGLNEAGLPLGVQVAASPAGDFRTIAVAVELERRLGGWVVPARL